LAFVKYASLRFVEFLQRFLVSIWNFGFVGAVQAHFRYRRHATEVPVSIWLRSPARRFYFRGAADRGVLSHFWTRGYRIREPSKSEHVKYIIDGGANIGAESLRFRHFHPQATVLAVEAEAGNFEVLRLNAAGDPKIIPIHAALWPHAGTVAVEQGPGNESFTVREASSHVAGVTAITVTELMQKHGFPCIDILKLDIEGSEKELFGGNVADWLSLVKVLIVEPPDRESPAATMQIFGQLSAIGREFNCNVHGENIVLIRRDVDWALESDIFLAN
jgi:FkbM family methyltransferase